MCTNAEAHPDLWRSGPSPRMPPFLIQLPNPPSHILSHSPTLIRLIEAMYKLLSARELEAATAQLPGKNASVMRTATNGVRDLSCDSPRLQVGCRDLKVGAGEWGATHTLSLSQSSWPPLLLPPLP